MDVEAIVDKAVSIVSRASRHPMDHFRKPLVALVEAAGGVMCDWKGAQLSLKSDGRVVTAATPALRDELLDVLGA